MMMITRAAGTSLKVREVLAPLVAVAPSFLLCQLFKVCLVRKNPLTNRVMEKDCVWIPLHARCRILLKRLQHLVVVGGCGRPILGLYDTCMSLWVLFHVVVHRGAHEPWAGGPKDLFQPLQIWQTWVRAYPGIRIAFAHLHSLRQIHPERMAGGRRHERVRDAGSAAIPRMRIQHDLWRVPPVVEQHKLVPPADQRRGVSEGLYVQVGVDASVPVHDEVSRCV